MIAETTHVGVDWGSTEATGLTVWRQRMDDATYKRWGRHWWACGWGGLRRRDRRRLHRSPALMARHRAWNEERDARIEGWLAQHMLRHAVATELERQLIFGSAITTELLISFDAVRSK